jgi:DNA-binding transcriptional ArsR family regulator
MADFKPKPGTFLPYMESSTPDKAPAQSASASPLTLLEILSRRPEQSLQLFDLQSLAGMQPSRYGEALKSLRDAGYISLEGEAPDQLVRLTGKGAEVVRLARPA